jgi:hypothetical protein
VLRRVLQILIILVTGIASAGMAAAQDSPLSLRALGADSVEAYARQPVTFVLSVGNEGADSRTVSLDPLLPEGWKALTRESEFTVEPSANELHLVSVLAPSATPAAEYIFRYRVRDINDSSTSAECKVKVVILPEISLGVQRLESPTFVIAGNEYVASFVITNTGNADAQADITVESGSSFPYEIRGFNGTAVAAVPAGAAAEFSVAVRTDAHIRESMRHPLQVTVRLQETGGGSSAAGASTAVHEARAASVVEVVPLSVDDNVLTHTIPFSSETTAVTGYEQGFNGGIQQEISARGTLDEAGEHRIELDLSKQVGTSLDPLVNPLDRYSFQYDSRFGALKLGDLPYTVSPLIALDAFGRGAQGTLNLNPVRLSALYFNDVWTTPGRQLLGGSADFTIPRQGDWEDPQYRVGVSALAPLDGRTTFGVFQQYNPSENLHFQADAALQADASGTMSPAVFAFSQGELGAVSWTTRYVRAWPSFEGTYSDTQSILGIGGVRLLDGRLNVHGTVSLADSNLLLNAALPNADRTIEVSFGAGGELPNWRTKLRLDWETWRREDRLPAWSYRTWDNILRLSVLQPIAPLKLGLDSMIDFERDEKNSISSFQQAHTLSLAYSPAESTEYGVSLRYNGQLESGGHSQHLVGADLNARYAFGQTQIEGQANNSYIFIDGGFSEAQVGISARLTHSFAWGHVLSVRPDAWLGYASGAWAPSFSLALTYRVPFIVPVSRKPDTAIVTGRVFNAGTGKPISGVILRLDGLAAITDGKGEYTFYLPHTGTEYIQVDTRTIGVGLVPVRPMPMELHAPSGSKISADIGLIGGCSVTGNVGEYGFPDQANAFVPSDRAGSGAESAGTARTRLRGLGNIIVELSDGSEIHRKLTGATGDFGFEEVRPGKYSLRIVEENLTSYSMVDPKTFYIELTGGERRVVEFRVLQEQRRIKIEPGETLNLGTPSGVESSSPGGSTGTK